MQELLEPSRNICIPFHPLDSETNLVFTEISDREHLLSVHAALKLSPLSTGGAETPASHTHSPRHRAVRGAAHTQRGQTHVCLLPDVTPEAGRNVKPSRRLSEDQNSLSTRPLQYVGSCCKLAKPAARGP